MITSRSFVTVVLGQAMALGGLTVSAVSAGEACVGRTIVPPGSINGTWTVEGSPYCVTGDIDIALLTIEPGVCVLVDGNYEIEVSGIILARGTRDAPIVFSAKNPAVRWTGLRFEDTQPGSELVHCRIEYANTSGIRIINSQPVITDCLIRWNDRANGSGGGIDANLPTGDLTLERCTFKGNTARDHGGGINAIMGEGALRMIECDVVGNVANPSRQQSSMVGGGIRVDGDSFLQRSLIRGNTARSCTSFVCCPREARAGGLYSAAGDAVLKNCVVRGNRAEVSRCHAGRGNASGGGVYLASGTLVACNTILSCNTLSAPDTKQGGGLHVNSGTAEMTNCTVARNSHQGVYRAGGTVTIDSSIVYFNGADEIAGTVSICYSDIQNIQDECDGCDSTDCDKTSISFNPVFRNDDGCELGDLTIQRPSLCIDAGNPDFEDACLPPGLGTAACDIGAHGGPGNCDWDGFPCPLDLDGSGLIDVGDILPILRDWGPCPECPCHACLADLNGDRILDVGDILIVLGSWGPCS